MMDHGRDFMGGMGNVDTWAYENRVVLGSCPSVRPKISGELAHCLLIYVGF